MRVFFEHSGFDVSQRWGKQALRRVEVGWEKMFERLPAWSKRQQYGLDSSGIKTLCSRSTNLQGDFSFGDATTGHPFRPAHQTVR